MEDSSEKTAPSAQVTNFIRNIIDEDFESGALDNRSWCGRPAPYDEQIKGGPDAARIRTRFPPEPNGYLHIGHAKSICLNFGLAQDYGGYCHMRFDDTNPGKESQEYVDSIVESVRWLGFDWVHDSENDFYFASNYFSWMYECATALIREGLAYVDEQSPEEMKENRGSLHEPGKPSPFRDRSIEENLKLFSEMKEGLHPEGSMVLRAKVDMASPNINMRDPAIYRIRFAHHHNTCDKWCIYPMYTFAHPLEDTLECITHSICTLEFEDQRAFYDWTAERTVPVLRKPLFEKALKIIHAMASCEDPRALSFVESCVKNRSKLGTTTSEAAMKDMLSGFEEAGGEIREDNPLIPSFWSLLEAGPELFTPLLQAALSDVVEKNFFKLPHQHEFNRLNLSHVITSKRKLIELVRERLVDGWDDPRMPTIFGLRRRGYTPESIRLFSERCGVSRAAGGIIDYSLLESCLREDLEGKVLRRMAVVNPLKLVIDNYPEDKTELVQAPNHPQRPELGERQVSFSRELWIDASDFELVPPKGYRRLTIPEDPSMAKPVRLRYAYVIKPVSVDLDADGKPVCVHCVYFPETMTGSDGANSIKTKAAIHWVDAKTARPAEFRLYDRLFSVDRPDAQDSDYKNYLTPESKKILAGYAEAGLAKAEKEDRFQFERTGYFVADRIDFRQDSLVFNLAVALKDTWTKK